MILYHSGHLAALGTRREGLQGRVPEHDLRRADMAAVFLRTRARLLSYADFEPRGHLRPDMLPELARMHRGLFLDSGAYSVASGKAEIGVEEYADFLDRWADHFDVVANLDVLPVQDTGSGLSSHEESERNQRYLEDRGHDVLPCFHLGEPWGVLEAMADEYDYLAIGGMAGLGASGEDVTWWLGRCFEIIPSDTRVHGFGVGPKRMRRFPWHSVDTTAWLNWARFGKQPPRAWLPPHVTGVYSYTARVVPWLEVLDAAAAAVGSDYVAR